MKINKIAFRNFFVCEDVCVSLPASGIVVIRGGNGAGKSTIIDAIDYAISNATTRGTSPRLGKAHSSVELLTDEVCVVRSTKSGTCGISWRHTSDADWRMYETATKANDALARVVDADVWYRTCVFDTERTPFGKLKDAERKSWFESMIPGLASFEPAYRLCLQDLNDAKSDLQAVNSRYSGVSTRLDGLNRICETLGMSQDDETFAVDAGDLESLRNAYDESVRVRDRIFATIGDVRNKVAAAEAGLRVAQESARRLGVSSCPTCGQPIPEDMRAGLQSDVSEHAAHAAACRKDVEALSAAYSEQLGHVQHTIQELGAQISTHNLRMQTVAAATRRAQQRQDQMAQALAEMSVVAEELSSLQDRLTQVQYDVRLLTAASFVLSSKGYRAKVIDDAVLAFEHTTNRVLNDLTGGSMLCQVSTTSETKKGGTTSSISFKVCANKTSNPSFVDYQALSRGQRRRVDIATTFALESMAGSPRSTLFFDEVFDGVDSDGIDRLVNALYHMSRDRCVVVITHSDVLAKLLPATSQYVVNSGKYISERS